MIKRLKKNFKLTSLVCLQTQTSLKPADPTFFKITLFYITFTMFKITFFNVTLHIALF